MVQGRSTREGRRVFIELSLAIVPSVLWVGCRAVAVGVGRRFRGRHILRLARAYAYCLYAFQAIGDGIRKGLDVVAVVSVGSWVVVGLGTPEVY